LAVDSFSFLTNILAVDSIPKDRDRLKLNQTTLAYDPLKNKELDMKILVVLF
jgi:hypothetical protein